MQLLDSGWTLATDPLNQGREERWFTAERAEAMATPVPGMIQQIFPDYHGVAWYWQRFRPARPPTTHERVYLRFGTVDYLAEVWLNGLAAGSHEGADTPFMFDITEMVKADADNLLAVRVLNPSDEAIDGIVLGQTPHRNKAIRNYQPGRGYNYGGITAPVEVLVLPAVRIVDLFARSEINNAIATGQIRVTVTLQNDQPQPVTGTLTLAVGPGIEGNLLDQATVEATFPPGVSVQEFSLSIEKPHLWDLHDPYLYRIMATLDARDQTNSYTHHWTIRHGFRDFRVVDGYFRLNGRRLFLRSTHTGNHYPMGIPRAAELDFIRRDLIYAKAAGFNMVRFICGMALAEQLDLCDEIGLMVYEESQASWCLEDSPQMAERYDRATREMILRDRNHPCLTVWGLLNETRDGAVFRQAVKALDLVRSLDESRLVLLSSGRWDAQPGIGSVSNPGSGEWEHVWGSEAPGAEPVSDKWKPTQLAYIEGAGDAHFYPHVPQSAETATFLRTLGQDTKPVFLSEYGIGSLFNAIREFRLFEQHGIRTDVPDAALIGSMAERLVADWQRFGMDEVYAFPEDMLLESQRLHARQRLLGFDLVRANPKLCGYNLTGILDHAITGEGLWNFWREWKPTIVDALTNGWAPLRWCLFCDPLHGYAGRDFTVEVVLANEDVLKPGDYPVRLRILGPQGVVWDKRVSVHLPPPAAGQDGPLAAPVLREVVSIHGPSGKYELAAAMEEGGAPAGGRLNFYLTDAATLPRPFVAVSLWGIEPRVEQWLQAQGIAAFSLAAELAFSDEAANEVILIGDLSAEKSTAQDWQQLARRIARGSVALFLSPAAFKRGDAPLGWLPLEQKGTCVAFHDWLYHKECVNKRHAFFDGLQAPGVMDWDYYGQVIPHEMYSGQSTPDDVAAAAFAVGYSTLGGYASGVLAGSYRLGAGRFFLNTLAVLKNIDHHPVADRLLINMISTAAEMLADTTAELPVDFEAQLARIGYA